MKIKIAVNKTHLFTGILLIAFSELQIYLLPEVDRNSAPLMEVYQLGLDQMFWSGVAILGWTICYIWGIVFLVRRKWPRIECKICETKIKSKDDIFCRECGAKLKEDVTAQAST